MAAAAKKEKVLSVKGEEASEIVPFPLPLRRGARADLPRAARVQVLEYLTQQNRPYGASEFFPETWESESRS